jgi:Tetratricopeptide repeat
MASTPPDGGAQPAVDETMARIGQAIALGQQGRRAEARAAFTEIWAEVYAGADPLHRCTLAHHMADVQDDPWEELAWDLRALAAAESITDERAAAAGATGPVAAFYPSLHLNLAEDHRKLGNLADARRHLELGRQAASVLGDDAYGSMVKGGLAALAERLSAAEATPPAPSG